MGDCAGHALVSSSALKTDLTKAHVKCDDSAPTARDILYTHSVEYMADCVNMLKEIAKVSQFQSMSNTTIFLLKMTRKSHKSCSKYKRCEYCVGLF